MLKICLGCKFSNTRIVLTNLLVNSHLVCLFPFPFTACSLLLGYDHREALFGLPPYGHEIAQKVIYADSDLCDENVNVHKGYPCVGYDENGQCVAWKTPFILMVDRGTCTFVTKVRHAQNVGASGVLIADNQCMCSDVSAGKCTNDPGAQCESFEPIMADDGSGGDITIPAFLVFKQVSEY